MTFILLQFANTSILPRFGNIIRGFFWLRAYRRFSL